MPTEMALEQMTPFLYSPHLHSFPIQIEGELLRQLPALLDRRELAVVRHTEDVDVDKGRKGDD